MAEGILMILGAIFIDLIAIVLILTAVLAVAAPVVTGFYSGVIQFWMTMKGLRGTFTVVNLATSPLPGKTIAIIAMIAMINNPKTSRIAGAARGKITKAAGK